MDQPLLSICIPTYKRAPFLRQCLESITAQFSDVDTARQVEIQISDNGSDDGTDKVAAEFQSKWPQIGYFRFGQNMGVDNNILNVVNRASGEYCWFLSDDDALFDDSLKSLLPILQTLKYDYLLANAWGYDKELLKPAVSRPNLQISENQPYEKLSVFVRSIKDYRDVVGYFAGFSCQIVRRQIWQNFPEREKYIGSQAIHMHVILCACKELPMLVLAKPLLKTRADNIRWDTFPGLETVAKRFKATRAGEKWVFGLYGIHYSNFKLWLACYGGMAYAYAYNFARTTIFRNQKVRNFIKLRLGK